MIESASEILLFPASAS